MPASFPFVGRRKATAQLQRLHAQFSHVLILGSKGVGKSALIRHTAGLLPLLICPESGRLSDICSTLEGQLAFDRADQRLAQRKNRLLRVLAERGQTVVFDGIGWTTPKLSSFLENVKQRVPVWIATRSEHPWDIGHFWPLLARFERVELQPFHLHETRMLVETSVRHGLAPADALQAVARLHRLASGNARTLCGLLTRLGAQPYDLSSVRGLRWLDLDRRIHQLPAFGQFHTS